MDQAKACAVGTDRGVLIDLTAQRHEEDERYYRNPDGTVVRFVREGDVLVTVPVENVLRDLSL